MYESFKHYMNYNMKSIENFRKTIFKQIKTHGSESQDQQAACMNAIL